MPRAIVLAVLLILWPAVAGADHDPDHDGAHPTPHDVAEAVAGCMGPYYRAAGDWHGGVVWLMTPGRADRAALYFERREPDVPPRAPTTGGWVFEADPGRPPMTMDYLLGPEWPDDERAWAFMCFRMATDGG